MKILPKRILPLKSELERYILRSKRAYVQWVKPRYLRTKSNPDKIPIDLFIKSLPVIYQKNVTESSLKIIVIEKDYPWTSRDVAIFTLGPSEPKMLYDLNIREGVELLKLNKKIVDIALKSPDCIEAYCAIGFNPEDDVVGCHTINRLHTHVCSIDNEYLASRTPIDHNYLNNWYYLLTFFEPFTQIYNDLINLYCCENAFKMNIKIKRITHVKYNKITLRLETRDFNTNEMFSFISNLLKYLSTAYKEIENIYTDCDVDDKTKRYLPISSQETKRRLFCYLNGKRLSMSSCHLLQKLSNNISRAESREGGGGIENHKQIWFSKGFSGAIIFRFKKIRINIMTWNFTQKYCLHKL